MRRHLTVLATIAALLWPGLLLAHGGGLDRYGCHQQTSTGGYHCHGKKEDDEVDWDTIAAVVGGLAVFGLVIYWLDDDDMGLAQPLRLAPYFSDSDHAGLVARYELGGGQRLGFSTEHRIDGLRDETRFNLQWHVGF